MAEKYGLWAVADVVPSVLGLALAAVLVRVSFFGRQFSARFFSVDRTTYDRMGVTVHFFEVGFLYVLVIAAQFRGVVLLADTVGVNRHIGVVVTASLVAAYAFRGFSAVTRTDVLQLFFMLPMYFVVVLQAAEPSAVAVPVAASTHASMPTSLVLALSLPLLFLPISQEIHQRGASAKDDRVVWKSYLLAATVFFVLGMTLVIAVTKTPSLTILNLLSDDNQVVVVATAVGIFAALLSTMDTSVNIASHALQRLPKLATVPAPLVQIGVLIAAAVVFNFFPTILSLILFALFVYMAGPALTFVAIYLGLHPRHAATLSVTFCALHAFAQFRLASWLPDWAAKMLEDTIVAGMALIGSCCKNPTDDPAQATMPLPC